MSSMEPLHDHEQRPIPSAYEGNQVPHLFPFFPTYDPSPYSCSLPFNPSRVRDQNTQDRPVMHDERFPSEDSSDPLLLLLPLPAATSVDPRNNDTANQFVDDSTKGGSIKWMSSKMRLMRKMMNSGESPPAPRKPRKNSQSSPAHDDNQYYYHQQQQSPRSSSSNTSPSGIIRVCSHCNTTKTPLWRSGPQGPKSLCNACGIRQRKARKAMAAAGMSSGTTTDHQDSVGYAAIPEVTMRSKEDCSELRGDHAIVPFKKRCKFTSSSAPAAAHKRTGFDDLVIRLSQDSPLHKVFPQDETKEAAILLMALSCGLVCQ